MMFNSWNSWSNSAFDIPWKANKAAELWDSLNAGPNDIVLVKKETRDIGPGEYRFAWEIGGNVDSTTKAFDILQDNKKWEVKAITIGRFKGEKTTTSFRGSPGALSPFLLFSEIVYIVSHLLQIFSEFSEADKNILNIPMGFDKMIQVLEDNREAVTKMSISFRRTFGFKPKTKKAIPIIGLVQILKELSDIKKTVECTKSLPYHSNIKIYRKNKQVDLTLINMLKIAKILNIPKGEIRATVAERLFSRIDGRILEKPNYLCELWNSVKAHETFSKADFFALIDENKGYFPMTLDDIDDYIQFTGMTKDLKFKVLKSVLEL